MLPTRGSSSPAGGAGHANNANNNGGANSSPRGDIRGGRPDRGRASSSHPLPPGDPGQAPSSPMQAASSLLNSDGQASGGASGSSGNPGSKPKKNWLRRLLGGGKEKSKADKGRQQGSRSATHPNTQGHTSQASINRPQAAAARAQGATGGMPSDGGDSQDDIGMPVDGDNFDDIIDSMFGFLDGHRPPQDARPKRTEPPTDIQPPPGKPKVPPKPSRHWRHQPQAGGDSAPATGSGTQRPRPQGQPPSGGQASQAGAAHGSAGASSQKPIPKPRTRIGAQQPIPAPRTRVGVGIRRSVLQDHGSGHGQTGGPAASSGATDIISTDEALKDSVYQSKNLVFVSETTGRGGEGQINFYFQSSVGAGLMAVRRSGFVTTEPVIMEQVFIVLPGSREMQRFVDGISSGAILNHRRGVLHAAARSGFMTSGHTPTPHSGAVVLRLTFEGSGGHAPIAAMHADHGRVCSSRTMRRLQGMIPQAYVDSKNISYV